MPIADAVLALVKTGELSQDRQYTVPMNSNAGSKTLMLSVVGSEQAPAQGMIYYGGLEPRQLRRVAAYISENLAENIPVAALAAVAGLSPSYFCRAFKVSVGQAPHAHIIRLRIERAMALMLETEDPLSQIAVACGLSDQSHLSKLFRDLIGTTPARWRHMRRH
jgi:AraC-like DNA-binding protein